VFLGTIRPARQPQAPAREIAAAGFVATFLPAMFRRSAPTADVASFAEAMAAFHPAGFRAMARASAEDLRGALPKISVPTLLLYGEG
jgi:pimeloyl-ACP methyl ester carboxylesterase